MFAINDNLWSSLFYITYTAKLANFEPTLFVSSLLCWFGNSCSIEIAMKFSLNWWYTGPWFNVKMSSYQYMKSHCEDKTVVRLSYLHNVIPILVRCHLYIESGSCCILVFGKYPVRWVLSTVWLSRIDIQWLGTLKGLIDHYDRLLFHRAWEWDWNIGPILK